MIEPSLAAAARTARAAVMGSPLGVGQRLDWIRARIGELRCWRDREWIDLDAWTFDGAPLAAGALWPERAGVHRLEHPAVRLSWPGGEARLRLDLCGEALVTLAYADGAEASFGSDPEHRELPLWPVPFAVAAEAVARLPFGEPNRHARLVTAGAVWIDVALERLVRRLELVLEAGRALGGHDAGGALAEAAARAVRELDWPSATRDYLSRVAGSEQMQNVWELPPGWTRGRRDSTTMPGRPSWPPRPGLTASSPSSPSATRPPAP